MTQFDKKRKYVDDFKKYYECDSNKIISEQGTRPLYLHALYMFELDCQLSFLDS
jgi:hypothetical protein